MDWANERVVKNGANTRKATKIEVVTQVVKRRKLRNFSNNGE